MMTSRGDDHHERGHPGLHKAWIASVDSSLLAEPFIKQGADRDNVFIQSSRGRLRMLVHPTSLHCYCNRNSAPHPVSSRLRLTRLFFFLIGLVGMSAHIVAAEGQPPTVSSVAKPLATVAVVEGKGVGTPGDSAPVLNANTRTGQTSPDGDIRVIFSDVDGTLVHYPSETANLSSEVLKLPPSATGMQGVISAATLRQCQALRKRAGQKLVLVSGMRTTTLLKRIPFLPRADAYCSEAGGRIFYPVATTDTHDGLVFTPHPYPGADEIDCIPFGLVEDIEWRSRMERADAAGTDGFVGGEISGTSDLLPIAWIDRSGLLWDHCRQLDERGYVVDTKGYAVCFRVNRNQQTRVSSEQFDDLLTGKIPHPSGLATSTNLGCVDYYPAASGKKNCCTYLARRFCQVESDSVLASHTMCICDDDNDLEMALACRHAFIPGVSSSSMARIIAEHPDHFTLSGEGDMHGTAATEKALERLWEQLAQKNVCENTST